MCADCITQLTLGFPEEQPSTLKATPIPLSIVTETPLIKKKKDLNNPSFPYFQNKAYFSQSNMTDHCFLFHMCILADE